MINKSKLLRFLCVNAAVISAVLLCGHLAETNGQTRDPFAKPGWARTREVKAGSTGEAKKAPPPVVNVGAPPIEQRIEFYKRLRENAAANGQTVPKVTSVLTLNEMAVTGIFRTPRGYAAMIEATPINLSYTIYPGEKFFDGQLVAVEENRLVFRKVTKMSNGKFVASVENKALRTYSTQEVMQGTAPVQTEGRPPETVASYQPTADQSSPAKTANGPIVSPLDEMNNQTPESEKPKTKSAKNSKKPVKVAKNK